MNKYRFVDLIKAKVHASELPKPYPPNHLHQTLLNERRLRKFMVSFLHDRQSKRGINAVQSLG